MSEYDIVPFCDCDARNDDVLVENADGCIAADIFKIAIGETVLDRILVAVLL